MFHNTNSSKALARIHYSERSIYPRQGNTATKKPWGCLFGGKQYSVCHPFINVHSCHDSNSSRCNVFSLNHFRSHVSLSRHKICLSSWMLVDQRRGLNNFHLPQKNRVAQSISFYTSAKGFSPPASAFECARLESLLMLPNSKTSQSLANKISKLGKSHTHHHVSSTLIARRHFDHSTAGSPLPSEPEFLPPPDF